MSASDLSTTVTGSATAYTQLYPQVYGALSSIQNARLSCLLPPAIEQLPTISMPTLASKMQ